jgi:DNA polymerase I
MPPKLYLIDGHALAYRTYYALTRGAPSSFTTSSGESTAGVFGFTSVLLRILEQERGNLDYLAVAFDTGRTFRDDIYPDYKGTRAKMPEDLRPQIERIRQLVDAFGIPRLELEGYEADDVMGSTAHQAFQKGIYVKIITGDRDLLQLVNERIIVNLPGKSLADSKDYAVEDVRQYMGVRPDQIVDLKALVGDKSDNIPGVPGIGEKTAVTLLEKYGTLESIYQHLDDYSESIRKKLEQGKDLAQLSRKLAKIVTDLDIPWDLEKVKAEKFSIDQEKVEAIFRQLEFRSLLGRLTALYSDYTPAGTQVKQLNLFTEPGAALAAPREIEQDFEVIDTVDKLERLRERLEAASLISFDTETTSTDQMRARLVGISLAVDQSTGYYIPLGHEGEHIRQLPLEKVLTTLEPVMTSPRIGKVGHNLKYDYVVLTRHGLRPFPLVFDTMVAEWLTNPASRNLGLKNLSWVRLDHKMIEIEELIGSGKNQIQMSAVPIEKVAPYAAADAVMVLRLKSVLETELAEKRASTLMQDIEMPLVETLADMEMEGVGLDAEFLATMSEELDLRLKDLEQQIYREVGEVFNLNSTQQLSVALFERLKLTPPDRTKKTASGHYSTSADVLEGLVGKSPVVEWILEYRELAKLKSTYVDALPQQINPETGRIHTSYNQTGSVTGRIASSDPNLQNIPIRTDLGRKVRHAFIAAHGHYLLSVDYSQVELRIVAHMANDQAMLAAFNEDQDIHAATAAAIFGIPLLEVTSNQRRQAKAINFGLIYGMSVFGLTRTTDLTLAESEDFVAAYFEKFPGVKRYLDQTRLQAAEQGYVETLLGRRRYFPGLKNERNQNIKNRSEREAINAPVQGTAADIMKIAMVKLPETLAKEGLSARLLLQVHDELVLECKQDELLKTAQVVCQVMETAFPLKIPLKTEARYGPDWGTMTVLQTGSVSR